MALTAWVEQDGELKVLGTVEEEARIFYDVSGNQLFIQTDDSGGTLVDRLTVSNAGLGTWAGAFTVSGVLTADGNITVPDDDLLGIGTGNTARLSWDTTDANANALLLQMPAGGAVDVPVLIIGQSIESVDFGLYNGVVDPIVALLGVGAVATATILDFRKTRGTAGTPTVITTGDDLGSIRAFGYGGSWGAVAAAAIEFDSTGTISTDRVGGIIRLRTATDAAPSVLTTALTISAAQLVTVAAGLTVTTGNVTLSANAASFTGNDANFTVGGTSNHASDVYARNVDGVNTIKWGATNLTVSASSATNTGSFILQTGDASAMVTRLTVTGTAATVTATWAAIYHVALKFGLAGTATGAFTMDGATSGVVTVTVAAAAGTWSLTLPTSAGANTNQLATNGSGVTSWTAEASLREYKDVLGLAEPQDALDKLLGTKVYHFRYRKDARVCTLDYNTVYTGIMADELPEVMQGEDWGINLSGISTFGYTVLAIQALETQIEKLQREVEELRGRVPRV